MSPHHHTKLTIQAEAFCSTCNKMTPHHVGGGILGRCMNDHPHPEPPAKVEDKQGDLFDE